MEGLQVSQKSLVLGLFLVLFSAFVFSAPLEITGSDLGEFEGGEITGGETISVAVNFTNNLGENLSFVPVLKVSSDEVNVRGPEFPDPERNFRGSINGKNNVGCSAYRNISLSEKSFYCGSASTNVSDGTMVAQPGHNELSLNFTSNIRIAPAEYNLEFVLRSWSGKPASSSSPDISEGKNTVNISERSHVIIDSPKAGRSIVLNYDELLVELPSEDSEMVSAVRVELFEGGFSSKSLDASGSLNISYPEGLDSSGQKVGLFYYDEATDSWENVTDERNMELNYVYSEVDHFSTYGVFSTPGEDSEDEDSEDNSSDGGNGNPGGGFNPPPPQPPVEEPQDNQSEENDSESTDNSSDTDGGSEDDSQEDSGNQTSEESGQEEGEEPEDSQSSGGGGNWLGDDGFFTGFASGSPGNVFVGLTAVLVALISVLQYTGRVDFVGRASRFSR